MQMRHNGNLSIKVRGLQCHARPGELILETPGGLPDPVTADRLLARGGAQAGADLPMVVLSGCSTGLAARQVRLHSDTAGTGPGGPDGQRLKGGDEGEAMLASFAAHLVSVGVP